MTGLPPAGTSYPGWVMQRDKSAFVPTFVYAPRIQPSNFALCRHLLQAHCPSVRASETHPSAITQWSRTTQPTILAILPITQCFPMTDRLMLARSSTRVERPIMESPEICALWSISERFSGSEGRA